MNMHEKLLLKNLIKHLLASKAREFGFGNFPVQFSRFLSL